MNNIFAKNHWHDSDTRIRMSQTFDRDEEITVKGEKVKITEWINAEEPNDIYYQLDKYGCLDKITTDKKALYADFKELVTLRDLQDIQVKANNMWAKLPIDIREKFNHDVNQFASQGLDWLKGEIGKEQKLLDEINKPTNIKNAEPSNSQNPKNTGD